MSNESTDVEIISSDKVEGTHVYDEAGEKLGSVDHLMIDKRTGQVRYAVLEFGGLFGIGADRYPIPWAKLRYDETKDGYVVPLDKASLEGAPKYSMDRAPTYMADFGRSVDGFYGIDD
jgi:sporulation protein YlmC with PRC-barrel domain